MRIELALFASLEQYLPLGEPGSGRRTRLMDLPDGSTVGEVIALLGLPDQPRVCFVDGRGVAEDALVPDGARLAITGTSGGLTKTGPGGLRLSGNSSFTGALNVDGGVLTGPTVTSSVACGAPL